MNHSDFPAEPTNADSSFFSDLRSARDWLKLLPLINTPVAYSEFKNALVFINASDIDALESLRILEHFREPLHGVQHDLQAGFISTSLPLSGTALTHWEQALALWCLLEDSYARCWRAATDGHAGIAEYLPLLIERTLYYSRMVMRSFYLVHRLPPDAAWQSLFAFYNLAIEAGHTQTRAKDSLIDLSGFSTAQAMLIHCLLLAAARTGQFTSKQVLWIDQRLEHFSLRTQLCDEPIALPNKQPLQADLAFPAPPIRAPRPLTGDSVVAIDVVALAQTLTKRIKLLREGELPQNIGLSTELNVQVAESVLTRLYLSWCEAPTQLPQRRPAGATALPAATNLGNMFNLLAQNGFAPIPSEDNRINQRNMVNLQLFGQAQQTEQRTLKIAKPELEQWYQISETAQTLTLERPNNLTGAINHQQLVLIINRAGQPLVGIVRILTEIEGALQINVQLMSGIPLPAMVRIRDASRMLATTTNALQDTTAPILLLPPMPALRTPISLLLPNGWYRNGRMLELWSGDTLTKIRLDNLQERGYDFDRVFFSVVEEPK